MKKSCTGCRALNGETCGLYYKTKRRGFAYGDLMPIEECPKPKTYDALWKLKDEYALKRQDGDV